MTQKLILPINDAKLTASWKTDTYQKRFGFVHYGVDLISTAGSRTVYASGNGIVAATGMDSVVGNVVAVRYDGAFRRSSGKVQDVILRYFHLDSVAVKAGQAVTKNTKLGNYGSSGQLTTGAHLHLEADTDTAHPLHSPTVISSSFLKGRSAGANDATMTNPLEWLAVKADAPDNQTWSTAGDAYIRDEDKNLPVWTPEESFPEGIQGIDVSAHNGVIDWTAVKAAGKNFAFIRIGWAGWDGGIQSNGGLDNLFYVNVKGALAAGLHVGAYVYSYCKTPAAARTAARETLELVKPCKLTYPIAFDIEDTSDSGIRYDRMSKADNSAIAAAFLGAIREAGYPGMVYTYKSFAENYLDMMALTGWDVWIAQYADACTYKGGYTIWQYKGDTGSCPGVTGACDLNVAYKDYAAEYTPPTEEIRDAADELTALRAETQALREELAAIRRDIVGFAGKWT